MNVNQLGGILAFQKFNVKASSSPLPHPQLFTPKAALQKPSSYFKSILHFCFLSNEDTFDFGKKKFAAPIKVKITQQPPVLKKKKKNGQGLGLAFKLCQVAPVFSVLV